MPTLNIDPDAATIDSTGTTEVLENSKLEILVIVAHPDDAEIVLGGSISKWISEGHTLYYCIVTDGDAGSPQLAETAASMASIRRNEQQAAAERLGVSSVLFLGYPDGQIECTLDLRRELADVIRRIRPDRIVTHSPDYNFQSIRFSHPDHLAVGRAVLAATFPDARNPHAFRNTALASLNPHIVQQVWMTGSTSPNHFVDITDHVRHKIDAVAYHESQLNDFGDLHTFFYDWARELAAAAGLPEGRLAEAFHVMDTE